MSKSILEQGASLGAELAERIQTLGSRIGFMERQASADESSALEHRLAADNAKRLRDEYVAALGLWRNHVRGE